MITSSPIARFERHFPDEDTDAIAGALGCSRVTALAMQARGINSGYNLTEARDMLRPGLGSSLSTISYGESGSRAWEILRSLSRGARIVVYGDYDVDGVASTALAVEWCLLHGFRVRYYIPHRHREGYGLHESVARLIAGQGCDLVIVVDCGTRDVEAVRALRDAGIPVVVFDHHLGDGQVAEADALVNPHIHGCGECRTLCATSVFWSWAWSMGAAPVSWLEDRLDMVGLATVADCVPLQTLNRALVQAALDKLRQKPRAGLSVLMERLGVSRHCVTETDLAMRVIPCLNAAGRIDVADRAVEVLLGDRDLLERVDHLVRLNRKRRQLSSQIFGEAASLFEQEGGHVLSSPEWPVGVLSGVASRLCRDREKPVVLAGPVGDRMRGTLRLPGGGNAVEILDSISDSLEAWGGHRFAAGFSVQSGLWSEVRKDLDDLLAAVPVSQQRETALVYDPSGFDLATWREFRRLGPFGVGNPKPFFYCDADGSETLHPLGRQGRHLVLERKGVRILAFDGAKTLPDLMNSARGLIYSPRIDSWQGRIRLQFLLERVVTDQD